MADDHPPSPAPEAAKPATASGGDRDIDRRELLAAARRIGAAGAMITLLFDPRLAAASGLCDDDPENCIEPEIEECEEDC